MKLAVGNPQTLTVQVHSQVLHTCKEDQGIRGDGGGCCWTSPYSSVEWDRDEYVAELLACATHMTVRSSCWPVLEEAFSIIRMISHLIME